MSNNIVLHSLGAAFVTAAVVFALYILFRIIAHAWYAEKRKHFDRVLKKLNEENDDEQV